MDISRAIAPLAGVSRRPEVDADTPFLLSLYGSTREQELALVGWTDDEKRAFVAMQFRAQREHYRREYPGAHFEVIERDGLAIGRLYVHERAEEIRVMEITLVPEARNQGVGRALLGEVLARGARTRCAVTIHVERLNLARRLYERLGFRAVGGEPEDSLYVLLVARPSWPLIGIT